MQIALYASIELAQHGLFYWDEKSSDGSRQILKDIYETFPDNLKHIVAKLIAIIIQCILYWIGHPSVVRAPLCTVLDYSILL